MPRVAVGRRLRPVAEGDLCCCVAFERNTENEAANAARCLTQKEKPKTRRCCLKIRAPLAELSLSCRTVLCKTAHIATAIISGQPGAPLGHPSPQLQASPQLRTQPAPNLLIESLAAPLTQRPSNSICKACDGRERCSPMSSPRHATSRRSIPPARQLAPSSHLCLYRPASSGPPARSHGRLCRRACSPQCCHACMQQVLSQALDNTEVSPAAVHATAVAIGIASQVLLCVFGTYRTLAGFSAVGCVSTAAVMVLVAILPMLDPHKEWLQEEPTHHVISVKIIPATSILAVRCPPSPSRWCRTWHPAPHTFGRQL